MPQIVCRAQIVCCVQIVHCAQIVRCTETEPPNAFSFFWGEPCIMDDYKSEVNPFTEMTGLEDRPLAGLRTALSRQPSSSETSERQLALWRQAAQR